MVRKPYSERFMMVEDHPAAKENHGQLEAP